MYCLTQPLPVPVAAEMSSELVGKDAAETYDTVWLQGKQERKQSWCVPGIYSLSSEKLARATVLYVTADTALFNHQPLGYFLINYSPL